MVINLHSRKVGVGKRESKIMRLLRIAKKYRVIADGRDITDGVFYVDGRRRIVRRLKRNMEGNFYVVFNDQAREMEAAQERLHPKHVRLVRK